MTRRFLAVAAAAILAGCGGETAQDTRLIAFTRAPVTNAFSDIYLLQTDGSLRRLTHGANDRMPAWSPDGRRIAFQRASGGKSVLYVANADGSGEGVLPDGGSGPVSWSPDGSRVIFTDNGRLYVTGLDWNIRILVLDSIPERVEDPQWSPDGKRIAFALGTERNGADVYVINASGSGRTRLTRHRPSAGFPSSPVWSPNGTQIAFVLPGSLRVVNVDGSGTSVLMRFANEVRPSSPAWSPDGKAIAFASLELGTDRRQSGIFVVETEGGKATHRLTRAIDSNPSWSPDGRQIVFERLTALHVSEITLMDRDGSNQRSLTQGGWSDSTPSWRPSVG